MRYSHIIQKFNDFHDERGRFCSRENAVNTAMPSNAGEPRVWKDSLADCKTFDDAKKILEEAMPGFTKIAEKWKDVPYMEQKDKSTKGDLILYDIYEQRGYGGKPEVVSDSDLEQIAADNGKSVYYRGFSDSASSSKTGSQKVDEFMNGKTYAGFGISGNGTYVSKDIPGKHPAIETARDYAEGAKDAIIKLTVSSDAKWGYYWDIYREMVALKTEIRAKNNGWFDTELYDSSGNLKPLEFDDNGHIIDEYTEDRKTVLSMLNILEDEGKYAALRGYDGYQCGSSYEDDDYNVILNHSKVIVSDKRYN